MNQFSHVKCPNCGGELEGATYTFICIPCEREFKKELDPKARKYFAVFLAFLLLSVGLMALLGAYGDETPIIKNNPIFVILGLLFLMGISFGAILKAVKYVQVDEETKTKDLDKWLSWYQESIWSILLKGLGGSVAVYCLLTLSNYFKFILFGKGTMIFFSVLPFIASIQFVFKRRREEKNTDPSFNNVGSSSTDPVKPLDHTLNIQSDPKREILDEAEKVSKGEKE